MWFRAACLGLGLRVQRLEFLAKGLECLARVPTGLSEG